MENSEKIRMEWDMYWILLKLEEEYDTLGLKIDFQTYALNEVNKLFNTWMEWLAEDERDLVSNL